MKLSLFKKITLDHFMTAIGIGGQLAAYVQAFKIFSMQSAYAVSLGGVLITFSTTLVWFFYGSEKKVKPLVISNFVGIVGQLLILIGILYYW
ncbi:MAG: hypothetical protein JSS34_05605 [Proteobacteria bacterium]|nr:hypothetical protein [Pseudomonadota bacterium]